MYWTRLLPIVAAAGALIALLGYGLVNQNPSGTLDDALARGANPPAPSLTLPSLSGSTGSVAAHRGRPVLLNFWASWCRPCEDEAPLLRRAQARLETVGGTVLGVTVDDATPDSQRFLRTHRLGFPSLRDADGHLAEAYGTRGVPETFAIDREGRVVAITRGQLDERFLDDALTKLGASSRSPAASRG